MDDRQLRTRVRRWALGSFGALFLLAACGLGALASAQPAIAALGCPGCYGFEREARRLYVDPAMPAETRATLRAALAEAPDRLAHFYGDGPASTPVVLACSDEACQRRINGGGALGVAYGSYGLRLSPRGLDGVILLHELSHIELHARFGAARAVFGGGVPAWFDEGVAVIVSGDPRYLAPEGTPGSRCRAEPGTGGSLPDNGRQWRHSGAVDHALYARAACRVLRWMDASGGPLAVGRLAAALAKGGRFSDLYHEP